ncbi:MAG: hypothetical protein A3J62_02400 [Candidatus Buchananbacteria bacterium RIFCSPHIGHO2_02_FULL_38_8]|uniref:Lipid-A-disaccharide synthase n=1 Tax=Candidatus Buchananbacteria bacterium RIFCSPHIGHO2_02_FULL_38_8 TaxID=1797538 RepID=A0A1G1Y4D4_9BACT|nr:MAG: hypothetical protein A3J62_02400 [Candidatus Buchananbacteria bacterium RIFCSPHIGHO2_02_FULL_38_8]
MNLVKKIIRKIKFEFQDGLTYFLIKLSVLVKSPNLTAYFSSLFVKNFNQAGQYRILCMRRSIFMDDIEALSQISGRLHYLIIGRNIFQIIFRHFSNKDELKRLTVNNYHSDQLCQEAIKKYNQYLKIMLPALRRRVNFDAIFNGNFVYIEQQEIGRVCEELGIPYVVLQKDSLTSIIFEDTLKIHEGLKFLGTRMLVYNEALVDSLGQVIDPEGVYRNKFRVVGPPRLDYLFYSDSTMKAEDKVVFFSFLANIRFPRIVEDQKKLAAIYKRAEDFHIWLMRFAQQHPNIKVIIKTKVAKYYLEYVRSIFRNNFKKGIDNLVITSAGQPTEMIKTSRVTCAFNSMTMIESVIANKVIVSPYFADLVPNTPLDYFGDYPQMVNYVKTMEELEDCLLHPENYKKYNDNDREKFLKRFIYIPDGRASIRAEDEIIKVIKDYQNVKK